MRVAIYGAGGGNALSVALQAVQRLDIDGWGWSEGTADVLVAESLSFIDPCKVTLKGSGFYALADILKGGATITEIIVEADDAKIKISGLDYTVKSSTKPNVVPIFEELLDMPRSKAATWLGSGADDIIGASPSSDVVNGKNGDDIIRGGSGNDRLYGGAGNDRLHGEAGNDLLWGGAGASQLYGGSGADRFVFKALKDSTKSAPSRIFDFSLKEEDRIDLSFMDADITVEGRQDFEFIGRDKYSGQAGELRFQKLSDGLYVAADLDGDRQTDFLLRLDGITTVTSDFFIL